MINSKEGGGLAGRYQGGNHQEALSMIFYVYNLDLPPTQDAIVANEGWTVGIPGPKNGS